MVNEYSPEEKLLHLIKGKHNPVTSIEPVTEELKAQAIPLEDISPAPSSDKVSNGSGGVQSKDGTLQSISAPKPIEKNNETTKALKVLFSVNHLILGIFIILVILAGYFIFNVLIGKEDKEVENLKALIRSFSETEESGESEEGKVPLVNKEMPSEAVPDNEKPASSFEDYQKLLNKKAIFAPPVISNSKGKESQGPSLRDLAKDLNLVGIIPGDDPQVIIEDKRNGQTLFLKKGEMIDTIIVKDIQNGRVVLEFNDETLTLSL